MGRARAQGRGAAGVACGRRASRAGRAAARRAAALQRVGEEREGKREGGRKEKKREREIRGENFGSDHDVGRACTAVAGACRGFGGKRHARNEGNRVMGVGTGFGCRDRGRFRGIRGLNRKGRAQRRKEF